MSPLDFVDGLFRHMEDDGQIVFCAIGDGSPRIFRAPPSDPTGALQNALDLNERQHNIYYGAATMRADVPAGSRGKESDIVALAAIVVDLDEPEAVQRYEDDALPLGYVPTYVVRTSYTPTPRYQLVYQLDEPCYDVAAWRDIAARLEHAWGAADTCSKDPAHVWRLPGTTNWPNDRKRQAGRTAELSELVEDNGETYFSLSDFEGLPPAPRKAADDKVIPFIRAETSDTWESWGAIVKHLPGWMQAAMMADTLPRAANGQPMDRSGFDYQIASEAIKAGLTEGDLAAMYRLEPNEIYAEKYREREQRSPGGGAAYVASTYKRAYAALVDAGHPIPAPPSEQQPEPEPVVDLATAWDSYLLNQHTLSSEPDEPIVYVAEPLLIEGYIHMVHGPTGCGKSYFGGHIGYCLALGRNAGPYKISAPKKVLYIDAEMGRRTIKRRVRAFAQAYGPDTESNFLTLPVQYIKRHHLPDGRFDLRNPQVQALITDMVLRHGVDVLELDNVRSAAPGMEENDKESWDAVNSFLLWLRSQRDEKLTILWHHHDNKGTKDGGTTYAGSTHAATNSEVRIALQPYNEEELAKLRTRVEKTPGYTATAAIHVKFGKHREFEWEEHQPHDVAYIKLEGDPEHGTPDRVQMHSISQDEDDPTVLTAMQELDDVARTMAEAEGKQNWRTLAGRMKAWYLVKNVGRPQDCAAKTLDATKPNLSKWLGWMREDRNENVRQAVENVAKKNTPAYAFN